MARFLDECWRRFVTQLSFLKNIKLQCFFGLRTALLKAWCAPLHHMHLSGKSLGTRLFWWLEATCQLLLSVAVMTDRDWPIDSCWRPAAEVGLARLPCFSATAVISQTVHARASLLASRALRQDVAKASLSSKFSKRASSSTQTSVDSETVVPREGRRVCFAWIISRLPQRAFAGGLWPGFQSRSAQATWACSICSLLRETSGSAGGEI